MSSNSRKSVGRQMAGTVGQDAVIPAQKLVATAQIMNFTAGTYSIEVAPQQVVIGPEGLAAPCIRLDRLRPRGGSAEAFLASLAETDLLLPNGLPAINTYQVATSGGYFYLEDGTKVVLQGFHGNLSSANFKQ